MFLWIYYQENENRIMKVNELKVTDLMVGDWCYIKDYPMSAQSMQVKEEHFVRSLVTFEPIPLTPEILEKNGFEKEGVIELYNLYAGIDHRVTIHDDKEYMNSNNEWYVHVDSEDYSTIAGCELTYVHELQHLLKLCKIYKEIVL